jgi:hypothetical protein
MERKKAARLRKEWGDKYCYCTDFDKEYYLVSVQNP